MAGLANKGVQSLQRSCFLAYPSCTEGDKMQFRRECFHPWHFCCHIWHLWRANPPALWRRPKADLWTCGCYQGGVAVPSTSRASLISVYDWLGHAKKDGEKMGASIKCKSVEWVSEGLSQMCCSTTVVHHANSMIVNLENSGAFIYGRVWMALIFWLHLESCAMLS